MPPGTRVGDAGAAAGEGRRGEGHRAAREGLPARRDGVGAHATWTGPVNLPASHIEPDMKWLDLADPAHVADFTQLIAAGQEAQAGDPRQDPRRREAEAHRRPSPLPGRACRKRAGAGVHRRRRRRSRRRGRPMHDHQHRRRQAAPGTSSCRTGDAEACAELLRASSATATCPLNGGAALNGRSQAAAVHPPAAEPHGRRAELVHDHATRLRASRRRSGSTTRSASSA